MGSRDYTDDEVRRATDMYFETGMSRADACVALGFPGQMTLSRWRWRAISHTFQGSAWQRCAVHLIRDCVREVRSRQLRRRVARILLPVFRAKDADFVRAMYHISAEMLEDCCPRVAATPEDAGPDALAYLDFPASHWRRLRTNNVQERTNREIKRGSEGGAGVPLDQVSGKAGRSGDVRPGRGMAGAALLLGEEDGRAPGKMAVTPAFSTLSRAAYESNACVEDE